MAGAAGTVVSRTGNGQDLQTSTDRPWVPEDPTKVLGEWSSAVGERSPFERPRRLPTTTGTASRTPHQDLTGTITPSDLHFERHHAGIPRIDPERHKLVMHGMVERLPRSRWPL